MPQFTVPGPVGRLGYAPGIIAFYTGLRLKYWLHLWYRHLRIILELTNDTVFCADNSLTEKSAVQRNFT
jgi:hypothetical protein